MDKAFFVKKIFKGVIHPTVVRWLKTPNYCYIIHFVIRLLSFHIPSTIQQSFSSDIQQVQSGSKKYFCFRKNAPLHLRHCVNCV